MVVRYDVITQNNIVLALQIGIVGLVLRLVSEKDAYVSIVVLITVKHLRSSFECSKLSCTHSSPLIYCLVCFSCTAGTGLTAHILTNLFANSIINFLNHIFHYLFKSICLFDLIITEADESLFFCKSN